MHDISQDYINVSRSKVSTCNCQEKSCFGFKMIIFNFNMKSMNLTHTNREFNMKLVIAMNFSGEKLIVKILKVVTKHNNHTTKSV